jgi:pyridoxine 5-phosphate synthase
MNSLLLGVNIDHIATLRQVRGTPYPDIVLAASLAVSGGADSITVHLREDRRHIQDEDVRRLKDSLKVPLNLELAVTGEMLGIAEKIKPAFCCFVPERREELTTEGGLDVVANRETVRDACKRMKGAGVKASLFIDADPDQIRAALDCGAGVIEIHTGHYADAADAETRDAELNRIIESTEQAAGLGMQVNAGHGLNYDNVQAIAAIMPVRELNIGHAIVAQAVFDGLVNAVRDMKRLMHKARM